MRIASDGSMHGVLRGFGTEAGWAHSGSVISHVFAQPVTNLAMDGGPHLICVRVRVMPLPLPRSWRPGLMVPHRVIVMANTEAWHSRSTSISMAEATSKLVIMINVDVDVGIWQAGG